MAIFFYAADEFLVRNLFGGAGIEVGITLEDFVVGEVGVGRESFNEGRDEKRAILFIQSERLLLDLQETHIEERYAHSESFKSSLFICSQKVWRTTIPP